MKTRNSDNIELLRSIAVLAGSSDKDLARLGALVTEVELRPGQVLTREGARDRQALLVVDGHGTVSIGGRTIAEVGPGEFIGEMTMLIGGTRTATVRATTPMRVLVIGPQEFAAFVELRGVARSLAEQLARRLRTADEELHDALLGSESQAG